MLAPFMKISKDSAVFLALHWYLVKFIVPFIFTRTPRNSKPAPKHQ